MEQIKELITHEHTENRAIGCQLARGHGKSNKEIFEMLTPFVGSDRSSSSYRIGDYSLFVIQKKKKRKYSYLFAIREGKDTIKKCTVPEKHKNKTEKFYSETFMELILS